MCQQSPLSVLFVRLTACKLLQKLRVEPLAQVLSLLVCIFVEFIQQSLLLRFYATVLVLGVDCSCLPAQ